MSGTERKTVMRAVCTFTLDLENVPDPAVRADLLKLQGAIMQLGATLDELEPCEKAYGADLLSFAAQLITARIANAFPVEELPAYIGISEAMARQIYSNATELAESGGTRAFLAMPGSVEALPPKEKAN